MLRAIYQSPALRAAAAFGLGGAAFTIANLILARALSSFQFGLLSLVIGVVAVAGPSAALGLDYVVARRGLGLGAHLRRLALMCSVVVALATVLICTGLYALALPLLLAIFVTTASTGISQAVAGHFQGKRQFGLSAPFTQASNWALMLVAFASWGAGITTATLPAALIGAAALLTSSIGWIMVARRTRTEDPRPTLAAFWSEASSLMTINVAGTILLQLERLIIPMTIGIENLALFGVAASLVGSPFRMLHMAVNFTVIPRLRDARSVAERRGLLRRELLLFAIAMTPTSILIWLLAPPLAHWFLGGRYDLSTAVIIAMIVSGVLKVLGAFGSSAVSALAPDQGLWLLSIASWICIAISVALAFLLRPWGLCGAIYAVSAGWFVRTCVALWISLPYFRAIGTSAR